MKEMKWNKFIFILCVGVYVTFALLFWFVFADNEIFDLYYKPVASIFRKAFMMNTVCQIFALIKREKHSSMFLMMGIIGFLMVLMFTVGQSV